VKKLICSVRDIVANAFANPFVTVNEGTALRDFSTACRDPESQLFKSPDSYSLYIVGRFDDDTGEIFPEGPDLLAHATKFTAE